MKSRDKHCDAEPGSEDLACKNHVLRNIYDLLVAITS